MASRLVAMTSVRRGFLLGGALVALSGTARAVTQPNGTVIPLGGALGAYLNGSANNDGINEGIDAVADAATEPQVFSPLCAFSGKYMAKGGGANFAIGWYNVDNSRPSSMPPKYVPVDAGANLNVAAASSDIVVLFPFSGALPPASQQTLTSDSIRTSPRYLGGDIGFVLIPNPNGTGNGNATQYHYTEHRFNLQCSACSTPGPWFSDLIYRSKVLADTFYLGFEDLDFLNADGPAGVNGNDLDYEDFLFRFTGVVCSGAGVPCDVAGAAGVCARGVTDCDGQGKVFCKQIVSPGSQTDVCDAVDNDCDGQVDNGAVCPGEKVCHQGSCVDPCSDKSSCPTGSTCQLDHCIENTCLDVVCGAGEVCTDGECRVPCAGVVCPVGLVCSADQCVDPCAGVTCDKGQICSLGVCISDCTCRACGAGLTCQASTGQCVEAACAGVTCEAGTYCKAGACVGLCDGVACPPGLTCDPVAGACVACLTDAQCSPALPICDAATQTCRGCQGDGECGGATPACLPGGACGQCSATNTSACPAEAPSCDVEAATCVGCTGDGDCPASAPVCQVSTHACVECLLDAQCAGGEVCASATHTCVECTAAQTKNCSADKAGAACLATNTCGCAADKDCGGASSGRVCDAASSACVAGCRGVDGNGCPSGLVCSSTTAEVGSCGTAGAGGSAGSSGGSAGAGGGVSGAGGTTGGAAGKGGQAGQGGAGASGAAGKPVAGAAGSAAAGAGGAGEPPLQLEADDDGGCGCAVPGREASAPRGAALAGLALLLGGLRGRGARRRAARG